MMDLVRFALISAFLLAAGLGSIHRIDANDETKPKPLQKMEFYQTSGEYELERLGNEGWQLVGGVQRENHSGITYLLQRPKQEEKQIAPDVIAKRTIKEWFVFASNARAKINQEFARKVLLTIAAQHKAGDELVSEEDQDIIRSEALRLLTSKDLAVRKDAAKILRPFVDASCRDALQRAAEEALEIQQRDKQEAREGVLLSEILKSLRPVADDSDIPFLVSLIKAPSVGDGFLIAKMLGRINSNAARAALEGVSADEENHRYIREVANEELDRMDFERREIK